MNTTIESDGFFADESVKETELNWAAKYARKLFNSASEAIESLRLRIDAVKNEAIAYTDSKVSNEVYPAINNVASSVNAASRAYTDEVAQNTVQTAKAYTDSTAESLQADIDKRLQIVQLDSSADLDSVPDGLYYTRASNANNPGIAGLLLCIQPYAGVKAQYILHDFGAIYFRNFVQGVWGEWNKKI